MRLLRALVERYRERRLKKMFPTLSDAFRVRTDLTVAEMCRLYLLARGRKGIVEIGSYTGASACCIGAALNETGDGKLVCIDTWNNDAMTEGNRDTWQEFQANTAAYRTHIVPVRGFSAHVVNQVAARLESIDLLFIDGDHSYAGVKADWEAYQGFLRTGSVVVFHDWGWAEGVKTLIEEEIKPVVTSFQSLPNMWWGITR